MQVWHLLLSTRHYSFCIDVRAYKEVYRSLSAPQPKSRHNTTHHQKMSAAVMSLTLVAGAAGNTSTSRECLILKGRRPWIPSHQSNFVNKIYWKFKRAKYETIKIFGSDFLAHWIWVSVLYQFPLDGSPTVLYRVLLIISRRRTMFELFVCQFNLHG